MWQGAAFSGKVENSREVMVKDTRKDYLAASRHQIAVGEQSAAIDK